MTVKTADIFRGCMPALMTPCSEAGTPNYQALVAKGKELIELGMCAVVYCGSMGEWPLLSDEERQEGVRHLVEAGIPTVVDTGAQNTKLACEHAAHARKVGAAGLMLIPRVLSRGTSVAAQRAHFSAVIEAGGDLPSVIYNSPYYGYETKADLFFDLREKYPSLVGFKEFGGAESLTYAAEFITAGAPDLVLLAGVDTQVYHGYVHCGASGSITGVGNALPRECLRYVQLCERAAAGDPQARRYAKELSEALTVLSTFDEGADLVLYYKHLMVLEGSSEYEFPVQKGDQLTASQKAFLEEQWKQFRTWWSSWEGAKG